jgi:hypothetical protein
VHPDLEALLTLQERDQVVVSADDSLTALEPETRRLDEALQAAERTLEQARRGVAEAQGRRETLEGKIASYRTMQEQRRQRLEWVRGAKEASTLMAELDLTRSVLAKEEADFMRSGDAVIAPPRRSRGSRTCAPPRPPSARRWPAGATRSWRSASGRSPRGRSRPAA